MDCVVSPVDQVLFVAEEDVSTTEFPSQKIVAPPAVIVGTAGIGFTVTATSAEVSEHMPSVTVTL